MKPIIPSLALLILLGGQVKSPEKVVRLMPSDLNVSTLQEGLHKYLVYIENPDGNMRDISIWDRMVSKVKKNDQAFFEIVQHWRNQDTSRTRFVYSLNDSKSFMPTYHKSISGSGKTEAFDIKKEMIVGTDSVFNNKKRGFKVELKEPTFNWELDLETIAMFPFEENTTFSLNFYHPGADIKPMYYEYKVLGKEKVQVGPNQSISCWAVRITYRNNEYATFLVSVEQPEVVKMEEVIGSLKRYKIKLQ